MSLSLTCVPAEEDPFPVEIVDHFRRNLEAVGVSTSVNYRSFEQFRLDVLVNHDFDVAVGRLPCGPDPDFLYALFHSAFVPEPGWQNPYGFTSVELDGELVSQRTGSARRHSVGAVLGSLAREQPVSPLVFPVEHRLVRSDRYDGFDASAFADPTDVLALDPGGRRERLEFTIGYTAPTKNLNPLSVEHRTNDIATGLLYDPLLVHDGDDYLPWLAEEVAWNDGLAAVTLRDAFWHDGEPVTAADVAFTYRLLADSRLGEGESPVPAPKFRGRLAMVERVQARDDRTLEFELAASREVAPRALTVPVLPEHEWEDRTDTADVGGIEGDEHTTEAFVTANVPPVGSGPYRFVDRSERDYVELGLVEDHFTTAVEELSEYDPPAEVVRIVVAPSEAGAIQGVVDGEFDFTLSSIPPGDISEELGEGAQLTTTRARDVYHVGYNARREPMSNAAFRRVVARLVDKSQVAAEVFEGEAEPTATLVAGEWVPAGLRWDGTDPETPFFDRDGELDVDAAREAFVDIGFRYDDDGRLRGTRDD